MPFQVGPLELIVVLAIVAVIGQFKVLMLAMLVVSPLVAEIILPASL